MVCTLLTLYYYLLYNLSTIKSLLSFYSSHNSMPLSLMPQGVFDGVTGVFTKPIDGAREDGVEGFFKGVGKGVVGLVTRPASGVIDFASGSFDAVMR